MIYSIENKILKATVDTSGAQLQSIYSKATETEYLWQGDPAYWAGRAYNLFPEECIKILIRMTETNILCAVTGSPATARFS